jgi:hypothetical protein
LLKTQTDNDKLREQLEYDRQTSRSRLERIDQLKDENDKLRELVQDMWQFTGTTCKKYPRLFDPIAQGGQMVQLNMINTFEQRMLELGIEVK